MSSTQQEQPLFRRTQSTGPADTPLPLSRQATSASFDRQPTLLPADDNVTPSQSHSLNQIRMGMMIISQQRWIDNQAHLIKIMHEQNSLGATLAQIPKYGDPRQSNQIQPPQTINWSFTVPLERILNPPRASSSGQSFHERDTTQMMFQPPYPSKTPNQNSANTPFILSFPQLHIQGVDVHQPTGLISENIEQWETPNPFMVQSGHHHSPIIEHHSPQPLHVMGSITCWYLPMRAHILR